MRIFMHNLFEPGDMINSPYEAFLFDTSVIGFPVRPHWHYYMEVLFAIHGSIVVSADEHEYTLNPGDMIALYPKSLHSIHASAASSGTIRYYVLKFDLNRFHENIGVIPQMKSVILQAETDEHTSIYFSAQDLKYYPVEAYIQTCINENTERNYGYYLGMHSSIAMLLLSMIRIWRKQGFIPSKSAALPTDHSIDTITEYIDAHSHQPLKVEKLAAHCNMSYSFFAKKFKQTYGRSCKEYIEYIRVTKAEDMLLFTDHDLNYISQETGFSDCSHMIKTFRKYKNITPKQFRMQNTKSQS